MMIIRAAILCCILVLYFGECFAEDFTHDDVIAGAARLYQSRISEAQSRGQLDSDSVFIARVNRIARGLIARATSDYPVARTFKWEIHITDATDESASCMAGGKLLIGQPYVLKLELNDAELAMLLSHEIQHDVLDHNFKEFEEALRRQPGRKNSTFAELEYAIDHDQSLVVAMRDMDMAQENEADLEGLRMAWRAGWPALALAGYFKKLARVDAMANFDHDDHPAASLRWRNARELAAELSKITP